MQIECIKTDFLLNATKNNGHIGNMSICKFTDTTYVVSARQFNYIFTETSWKYTGKGFFDDRLTFFIEIDSNFNFIRTIPIINKCGIDLKLLEDIRLVKYGSLIQCSATYVKDKVILMIVLMFSITNNGKLQTTKNVYLSTFNNLGVLKNWIPIERYPLRFIYNINDGFIDIFDLTTLKHEYVSNNILKMSGSSLAIWHNGYYYVLTHKRNNKTYSYKVIRFTSHFLLVNSTNWFKISNFNVEFSCGICFINNELHFINTIDDDKSSVVKLNYIFN